MSNTVYQVIADFRIRMAQERMAHLIRIDAPQILIDQCSHKIDDIRAGKMKVEGMARKFKIANELVAKVESQNVKGTYYKGNANTVVLTLTLEDGRIFYFDFYGCKIADKFGNLFY